MEPKQLREYVVEPVLALMTTHGQGRVFNTPEAIDLLMGTAAQESHVGMYIHQIGGGPAKGIFQMEPGTYHDIWEHYIGPRPDMREMFARVTGLDPVNYPPADRMVWDLQLATIMCRLHYYRVNDPLPDNLEGQARYWKQYYNTNLGAGSVTEYLDNYARFLA